MARRMSTSLFKSKYVILPLSNMMYPFMTLDDNAKIVHSEMGKDGRANSEKGGFSKVA